MLQFLLAILYFFLKRCRFRTGRKEQDQGKQRADAGTGQKEHGSEELHQVFAAHFRRHRQVHEPEQGGRQVLQRPPG